jgi:hypothetical protein
VEENLQFFASHIFTVKGANAFLSAFLGLKLDVPVSFADVLLVDFQLARHDFAKFITQFIQIVLSESVVSWQISQDDVGLLVEVVSFLLVQHDLLAVKHNVVLFAQASLSFFFSVKVQVAEALRLSGFQVKHYLGVSQVVSAVFEELEHVVVERCGSQVANVQAQFIVVSLLCAGALLEIHVREVLNMHWRSLHGHGSSLTLVLEA